jgi:ubiquinone/menaquinone biosynthesis C-methylase UbiE
MDSKNQNSDMLEAWQESAKYWAQHRDTIHVMFAPLTQVLIETAQIREGQNVLDVAGGAGDPSLTIAELVGPAGHVTYTDAVAQMVETARGEASRRGISSIEFHQCVADALPFPENSFDVVVSRLGVMLFPDPLAAVREMLRVLKPNGRLAFAVWHQSELNPFCYVVSNVIDQYIKSAPTGPDEPGAFRFAEPGKLPAVMKQAGAVDVEDFVFSFNIAAPISPLQFWLMRSQTSDTLRQKLAQLSSDEQAVVTAKIKHGVKEFFPDDKMQFPARMIIATAKKL